MNVSLRPEYQRFVEEKVKTGEYPSADEVVQAGIERLMEEDLDDETLAAIEEGEAQLDRGQGIPVEQAFAELRKKHLGE